MKKGLLLLFTLATMIVYGENNEASPMVDTYLINYISPAENQFEVKGNYGVTHEGMRVQITRKLTPTQLKCYQNADKSKKSPYLFSFMNFDRDYSVLVYNDKNSKSKFCGSDGKIFDSITEVVNHRYGSLAIFNELKEWSDNEVKIKDVSPHLYRLVNHANLKERLEGLMDRGARVWIAGKDIFPRGEVYIGGKERVQSMIDSDYNMVIYELTDDKIKLKASMRGFDKDIYSYLELDYDKALDNFIFVALGGDNNEK